MGLTFFCQTQQLLFSGTSLDAILIHLEVLRKEPPSLFLKIIFFKSKQMQGRWNKISNRIYLLLFNSLNIFLGDRNVICLVSGQRHLFK